MALTVTCRSRNRASAITADLQELNEFIKDQRLKGREVDLTDWERFSCKLNAWRRQKKQVVS